MHILAVILGLLALAYISWLFRKSPRKILDYVQRRGVHPDFHSDLESKILELKRDPEMSDAEWEEMIKISQYADDLYSKTYKNRLFGRLTDLVESILKSKKNKKE